MAKIKISDLDALKLNRPSNYETPEPEDVRTIVCAEIRDGVKYFKRKLSHSAWTEPLPAPAVAQAIVEEWRIAIERALVDWEALRAKAAATPFSRIDMILGQKRKVIDKWIVERDAIARAYDIEASPLR